LDIEVDQFSDAQNVAKIIASNFFARFIKDRGVVEIKDGCLLQWFEPISDEIMGVILVTVIENAFVGGVGRS